MGKLAEIAKASGALKGGVTVNFADGTSRTFANESEAEKACVGKELEHRRGAFYEVARAESKPSNAKKPK